jgi:hypothetical protein
MPVDDEPEQPQSIASLRSKFENLAADQKGLREKERSRPASPTPAKVPAAGSWARNGQGVLNRPATGRGEESGEVEGVDAARRAGIALPLESGGQRGPAVDGLLFDGGVSGVGHNQVREVIIDLVHASGTRSCTRRRAPDPPSRSLYATQSVMSRLRPHLLYLQST